MVGAVFLASLLQPLPVLAERQLDSGLLAQVIPSLVQYFHWKDRAATNISICTLGTDGVGDAIAKQNIPHITVHKHPDYNHLSDCHILYISDSEAGNMDEILWKIKSQQIISISSISGFAARGGIMQFITKDNKLSFRFNIKAAKAAKVVIASDFLSISELVE